MCRIEKEVVIRLHVFALAHHLALCVTSLFWLLPTGSCCFLSYFLSVLFFDFSSSVLIVLHLFALKIIKALQLILHLVHYSTQLKGWFHVRWLWFSANYFLKWVIFISSCVKMQLFLMGCSCAMIGWCNYWRWFLVLSCESCHFTTSLVCCWDGLWALHDHAGMSVQTQSCMSVCGNLS